MRQLARIKWVVRTNGFKDKINFLYSLERMRLENSSVGRWLLKDRHVGTEEIKLLISISTIPAWDNVATVGLV